MSQQKTELKINPEYLALVPRPTKERYEEIKEDIRKNGQMLPIVVNDECVILDGHTRNQICAELGIEPKVTTKTFPSKMEEERFVYAVNVKRRDLPDFVHIKLSLKLHELDLEIAKQKRLSTLKNQTVDFHTHENREPINTTKEIAKETKTSHNTVSKVKKILALAPKSDIEALEAGRKSINEIYFKIHKEQKKKERQEAIMQTQINLPKNVRLYNQKFQDLNLEPNSVSLIFTDPDYTNGNLYLYDDLAKQAMHVLRDGGSLMCYVGHYCIPQVLDYMQKNGLTYHWIVPVLHGGPTVVMHSKKILVGYKPLLWFTKGRYDGEFVKDVIKSQFQGKELHEWGQSTVESDYYIKHLTLENDIVYDPMMGQGTFGQSAVKLNRQFIGCEINSQYFEIAQKLISAAKK